MQTRLIFLQCFCLNQHTGEKGFFFWVVCLRQPRVLYQRPGSLRVLGSILAVPSTALFWTEFWCCSWDLLDTLPAEGSQPRGLLLPWGPLWSSPSTSSPVPFLVPGTSPTSLIPSSLSWCHLGLSHLSPPSFACLLRQCLVGWPVPSCLFVCAYR